MKTYLLKANNVESMLALVAKYHIKMSGWATGFNGYLAYDLTPDQMAALKDANVSFEPCKISFDGDMWREQL